MNEEEQPTKKLTWRWTMTTRKGIQEVIPKKLATPTDRDAQNEKIEVAVGGAAGRTVPWKNF